MNAAAVSLWESLSVLGGGFAVLFILALGVGIGLLTLLFTGSAVVVLERFARGPQPWRARLGVTVAWSLLLAPLVLSQARPDLEVAGWGEWLRACAVAAGAGFALILAMQAGVALLLRLLPSGVLGGAASLMVGAAFAFYFGGAGQLAVVAVAFGAVAGVAAGLAWRRRRRGQPKPGAVEWVVRTAALALLLGCGIGPVAGLLLGPPPWFELSAFGAVLAVAFVAVVLLGLFPLAAAGFLALRGSAEWFVATRYLFATRRQTFISVITGICVVGVAAGVWLIITVLSVMNGFERTWRDEIIGNRAHFTVQSPFGPIEDYREVLETLDGVEGVVGASPYVEAEGMVRGRQGEIVGVRVRGIDPERIGRVTDLPQDLQPGSEGALGDLAPRATEEGGDADPGLIVGTQLAALLGLRVGDSVMVISPFGGPPTPLGPAPRLTRFRVAGTFQSSFFQYDEVYTYTSLEAAQDFRRSGDVVNGIEARTTDFYRSQRVAADAKAALDYRYYTRDWKEFFPAFFQALKTERVMMFVLLTMIMVVAAFAIVVTLVMMIMEKSSDIAILKAMGATDPLIERIFAIEGTLIGLLGTSLGVVAGIAVTTQLDWVQEQIELITGIDTLPATVYQFSRLPWEIDVGQVAFVVGIAMILSLGATLLPSRHGARLEPAEALRYE